MLALIQAIHVEFKGAYGSPRMVRELRLRGFPASKERVGRLMQENDIRAKHKRRFKVTTDSKHNLPIAPNLLDRNFTPSAPDQVWTSDTPICGRMVIEAAHDGRHRGRRADDGVVPPQADRRTDTPLGSRQPIRQPRIPRQAEGIWHGLLDEPQGQLLGVRSLPFRGQRTERELVRQLQERAGVW
ncbi:MAG: IS3 family transposase [Nitrosomonadales bacterium]|nr:IS3 family transposase [Nitrosomonadales bacterium]